MAGGRDPGFILYILFIVVMGGVGVIKNVLRQKAQADQKRRRAGKTRSPEDEWEGWETVTAAPPRPAPPPPPAAPRPSSKVEAILQELERKERAKASPPSPPPPPPAKASSLSGAGAKSSKRRYLSSETPGSGSSLRQHTPRANKTERELMSEALTTAFPAGVKRAREASRGQARPIVLNVRGRRNLRQGILFAEVLARPRAFDL
ncbi:MAG: hypothetical protein HN742_25145 [Lentisphaerae bacterium]|mgnify:CR=1 FL=1|jgi:hypothetical protein|nr:hypothetical protein [Lentisphaerota bacterium]MBT4819725.1 hypothetical protein [Lentisphaerota bacterium]MBT5607568.1 hypothetical protein [Lentisphaerota bacterium]MBT7054571.1 hypothetical protein [Lentisphaerota bacterium]MBT7845189.1 hypothetical protein [Lentisphaerota bacterium]